MPTNKELEQELQQLRQLLAAHGITPDPGPRSRRPEDQADYIAYGSDKYLIFLGLEKVDDIVVAEENRYVVYSSPETGQAYRLIDEMQAMQRYPGVDPEKAALVELRQKVNSFESGKPEPHAGAPTRFIPPGDKEYTRL